MAEITPVTEWPDYATDPQGGDPFTQDLNAPYDKVSGICGGSTLVQG
jgi:ammonium transporter, Amt family